MRPTDKKTGRQEEEGGGETYEDKAQEEDHEGAFENAHLVLLCQGGGLQRDSSLRLLRLDLLLAGIVEWLIALLLGELGLEGLGDAHVVGWVLCSVWLKEEENLNAQRTGEPRLMEDV